jgi:mono/diheme cytochrome c family protein
MTRVRRAVLLLAIAASAVPAERALAQDHRGTTPPLVISSMYGRDLYQFYCASCHGRDGKGNGPVAPALKAAMPDITVLAIHNGGVFPRARIEAIVTGRADPPLAAHGSREMPVWGPIFRGLDPNETVNRLRIANILDHLESIQARYAMPPQPHRRGPAPRPTPD